MDLPLPFALFYCVSYCVYCVFYYFNIFWLMAPHHFQMLPAGLDMFGAWYAFKLCWWLF